MRFSCTAGQWQAAVRTLDALHLATIAFLREHGKDVALATYDVRVREAAEEMGIAAYPA